MHQIRLFAALRDRTGASELSIDLPAGATVRDLKSAVEARIPALSGRLGPVRVAADHEFLSDDDVLPDGAELALIPPVSGGAPETNPVLVALSDEPLSLERALAFVRSGEAGAIATFLGTVRGSSRDRAVLHLDYEAYGGMAVDCLGRIGARAVSEGGAFRAAILHRTGRVPVGGDSVVIAVSARHRDEAFKACRGIIEALKADVPIWKKEVYDDGEVWVGWGS